MRAAIERRQFGRRNLSAFGWIAVAGRRDLACRISNITPQGAFLELEPPKWLPFAFDLVRDGGSEAIRCEIRHVMPTGIGVRFVQGETQSAGEFEQIALAISGRLLGR